MTSMRRTCDGKLRREGERRERVRGKEGEGSDLQEGRDEMAGRG